VIPALTATEIRTIAIARGRAIKRVNAWTAVLCGGLPAVAIDAFLLKGFGRWLVGFVVGLLWANLFEYAYHRFLLHLPGTFFAKRHLGHHATVGTPTEPEHVNLGSSPIWVVALFAIKGIPVGVVDLLFGFRIAPGILLAFTIYFHHSGRDSLAHSPGGMATTDLPCGASAPPGAPHVPECTVQHFSTIVGYGARNRERRGSFTLLRLS